MLHTIAAELFIQVDLLPKPTFTHDTTTADPNQESLRNQYHI